MESAAKVADAHTTRPRDRRAKMSKSGRRLSCNRPISMMSELKEDDWDDGRCAGEQEGCRTSTSHIYVAQAPHPSDRRDWPMSLDHFRRQAGHQPCRALNITLGGLRSLRGSVSWSAVVRWPQGLVKWGTSRIVCPFRCAYIDLVMPYIVQDTYAPKPLTIPS